MNRYGLLLGYGCQVWINGVWEWIVGNGYRGKGWKEGLWDMVIGDMRLSLLLLAFYFPGSPSL